MKTFPKRTVQFLVQEDATTAVEYAAIILIVILGALTIITAIGQATAANPHDF